MGYPLWNGCGEVPGGTARSVLFSSWRAVTSEGSSLCPSGSFGGNKGEWVLRQSRVFKAGYRLNVEIHVVLFEGFPESAIFRAPLYQEFFYPRLSASMADAYWLASGQDSLDGSFVPWGIATPEGFDSGGSPAFVGFTPVRSIRFLFCGEVQQDAGMLSIS